MKIWAVLLGVLVLSIVCMGAGKMKKMREPLSFERLGSYAEFSVNSNLQVTVRSFGYADSYHSIVGYYIEKDVANNTFYISYYLNKRLNEKSMPNIKYHENGTVEVAVNIPEFNEASNLYYRDETGTYVLVKGNEKTWKDYLKAQAEKVSE